MKNISLQPSEELAYWIGVVQSDGCLSKNRISIGINNKSLSMLKKFAKISYSIFKTTNKITLRSRNEKNIRQFRFSIGKLLSSLKLLDVNFKDPPNPPFWCLHNYNFFGAYLAGVVDGDGNIRIKRKKYPQCAIRIISGKKQTELYYAIRKMLNCAVSITLFDEDRMLKGKKIHGKWFELEFLVSSKNLKFVKDFILPHLTIEHKRNKLKTYIGFKSQLPHHFK